MTSSIVLGIFIILVAIVAFVGGYIIGAEDLENNRSDDSILKEKICCQVDLDEKTNQCVPAKCYKYIQK